MCLYSATCSTFHASITKTVESSDFTSRAQTYVTVTPSDCTCTARSQTLRVTLSSIRVKTTTSLLFIWVLTNVFSSSTPNYISAHMFPSVLRSCDVAESLSDNASAFSSRAKQLHRRMWWRDMKVGCLFCFCVFKCVSACVCLLWSRAVKWQLFKIAIKATLCNFDRDPQLRKTKLCTLVCHTKRILVKQKLN